MDTKKAECLARSAKAKAAAVDETNLAALYAVSFGGSSELAVSSMARVEQLNKAAIEWASLAAKHPQTIKAAFRSQSLPVWMFGF